MIIFDGCNKIATDGLSNLLNYVCPFDYTAFTVSGKVGIP